MLEFRPFQSVDEMNTVLINNWNEVVNRGDRVYHLGDFAIHKNVNQITKITKSLNGQKFLVYGNHDWKPVKRSGGWTWKGDYKRIRVGKQIIVLLHYAMISWDQIHKGSWHLHGHSHGNLRGKLIDPLVNTRPMMDVGVDANNYYPISYDQVRDEFRNRNVIYLDHHKT